MEGKFKVLTPGEFDKAVDSVQTPIGKMAYHILIYNNTQKNAENLFYMITFCDYPEGTIHSDSTELLKEFFDASIDQALKSVKGELAYQSDISLQGYPGKLWRINYLREQALIKTRAVDVHDVGTNATNILVRQPCALRRIAADVVNEHITDFDQSVQGLTTGLTLEVPVDIAFAAVQAHEHRPHARCRRRIADQP